MTKRTSLMLTTITTMIMCSAVVQADIIHVPADYPTIQDAIDVALDGDEIVVAPGIYHEVINFLGKAIMLRSSNGPEVTTIDGTDLNDSVVKCISGEGAETILEGFAIRGGQATLGGGMYNDGSSPTVRNCIFTNNLSSDDGGGMANENGSSPEVTNTVFDTNHSERFGGAIANRNNSAAVIRSCTFTNNSAGPPDVVGLDGGAIMILHSDVTIANCRFVNNFGAGHGGAIYDASSSPTIDNCEFIGNRSLQHGGAIANGGATPVIKNCTFYGNISELSGGAVSNGQSTATITNCIAWANLDSDGMGPGTQIRNTEGPNTTIVSFSDVMGGWTGPSNGGNIDAEPLFVDPENGDFHLVLDSPCIDVGDNSVIEEDALDIDGEPRIGNDIVDMGADEAHDCNGNLVLDYVEIAKGSIPDNNGNQIPDNCDCPADFDFNGTVDAFDLAVLLGSWGPCPEPPATCPADIHGDHDGIVRADDLAVLLGSWGACP